MRFRRLMQYGLAALASVAAAAQERPEDLLATPGRPGSDRKLSLPHETDSYRSTLIRLGANRRPGLLYEPKRLADPRVAVVYSDRNFGFDPPAADLATRGYRVIYVSYPPLPPGAVGLPSDGFRDVSDAIAYLHRLPGVERVIVEGWGAGAGSAMLYAAVAAHGAAACQGPGILFPCRAADVAGLARPDGMILLDPGGGSKAFTIDPAFDGAAPRRAELDALSPSNGYDVATGTARYSAEFRKRYFAAQSARNNQVVAAALARWKALNPVAGDPPHDEPLVAPGVLNMPPAFSLASADVSLLSHTRRPHDLLRADGATVSAILRSVRPARGPKGAAAVASVLANERRGAGSSLFGFLANEADRTTPALAMTDDDITGVDWRSGASTPFLAQRVTIPTVIVTNTCFGFVVPSEIVLDHLAAKDKVLAGVEGSEHEFGPCEPRYGATRKRLFDYVAAWLGRKGRF